MCASLAYSPLSLLSVVDPFWQVSNEDAAAKGVTTDSPNPFAVNDSSIVAVGDWPSSVSPKQQQHHQHHHYQQQPEKEDHHNASAFDTAAFTGKQAGPVAVELHMPDKAERDALFRRVDYNGNGMLSLAEIDKCCRELWPHFDHKPALMRAYKAADRTGDGFIRRREFRLLLRYVMYFNTLWDKFEAIDEDGDRRLNLQEFVHSTGMLLTDHLYT